MDKNRLLMIGAVLAIAIVGGLGYVLGVQPQLAAAQAADLQRSTIAAQNASTQDAITKMRADYGKLNELKAQLATLQTSIPSSPALDKLLSTVYLLASSTGATVTAFTPSDAVAYLPPAAPAPAPAATGKAGSSPSPSATPAPSAAPAAPTAPQAPTLKSNPLITAQNFVAIPVKIGIQAPDAAALAFLDKLQNGPRLFMVTSFSGGGGGAATASGTASLPTYTIGGYVYVLASPKAGTVSPGAAGATPTPTSTPAPTATPKP
ncbi:hypothetical protein ACPPVQ_16725 [Diaminobutyricibacter sp. McL0618]|uniref:hypothetical protein n=1 Tax=Leifsonia sp. McL0618 TaxID=3415677 RepID=UPI003CEF3BB8